MLENTILNDNLVAYVLFKAEIFSIIYTMQIHNVKPE